MTPSNSDRIAICGEFFPSFLKHRVLFFDRIGVNHIEVVLKFLRSLEHDDLAGVANDLEFLRRNNYVFEAQPLTIEAGRAVLQSEEVQPEQAADFISAVTVEQRFSRRRKRKSATTSASAVFDHVNLFSQFTARICARHLQHSKGLEASAVLSEPLIIPKVLKRVYDGLEQPSADVVEVVLDKFPMPSELTPWEAILDFKADSEAQGYLQGLKVWMSDVARQKLTSTAASEKLDWLLFQHKKHLEMHKLSYRWGTLGGTFVAAAEILEDLVKIKWSKAVGAVVSIVDRRLELMKAELDNPAKEVSYIVKAQEQFGE